MSHPSIHRFERLDQRAAALLVLCCGFWGLQQILIKGTVSEVPPFWQASLRFWIASAFLFAWCRWRRIDLFSRDGSWRMGLLAGALFAGEFAFIYAGLQFTNASRLTIFLYTSPFWVAALLPLLTPSEHLRRLQWWGLLLAFFGVVLAFSQGLGDHQNDQWRGDLMGLVAGMLWGLTTLVLRSPQLAHQAAERNLFFQIGTTALVLPWLSLAWGEPWQLNYSLGAWSSIALQSIVGAFASYLIWMWLLRHYPATRMASFTFLTPVFALIFGVGFLGEALSLRLVLSLSGVAVGIWLVNKRNG